MGKILEQKAVTINELNACVEKAVKNALGKIDDETYEARCVLHFINSVFRELAGNMTSRADVYFEPMDINGLFLTMNGALETLEAVVAPGNVKEVEA
jgi:hypothetical protein